MEVNEKEVSKIPDSVRVRILEYYNKTHGKPKNISPDYWYMIRKGKKRVSDTILVEMLKNMTPFELSEALGSIPSEGVEITNRAVAISWFKETLKRVEEVLTKFPDLHPYITGEMIRFLNTVANAKHEVTINREHIEKFELLLKQKGVSKTVLSDRINYLKRALEEMGWVLSEDRILKLMINKQSESKTLAEHYAKALKLFIKEVLKDQILYNSFKTPRAEPKRKVPEEVLDIEFHRKVFHFIPHLGAKAYYLLLAETGWRPSEIMSLKMNNVNFEKGIISLEKVLRSKRAYITFIHTETLDWLKKWYLPYRESWVEAQAKNVERIGQDADAFKQKLFPFKDDSIREAIREAVKKAKPELADTFTLYYLRHFWSTYVRRQNAPADIVNLLQGRAPPKEFKILVEGYTHYSIEDLRRVFEKYAPKLLGPET